MTAQTLNITLDEGYYCEDCNDYSETYLSASLNHDSRSFNLTYRTSCTRSENISGHIYDVQHRAILKLEDILNEWSADMEDTNFRDLETFLTIIRRAI